MSFPAGVWFAKERRAAPQVPLLVAALTLCALVLRLGPPPWQPYRIVDPDSLYHFRLAQLALHDFPRPAAFDPYLEFPAGATVPWSFLQDWLAAGVARLAGGGAESLRAVCFFWPAVLGAACLPLVFGLARDIGLGVMAAGAAAALSSLVPAHLAYSAAGRFDHHITDLVLALLFARAVIASWRRRGERWRSGPVLATSGAVALAAAALPANWLGATLHLFTVLCAIAAGIAIGSRSDRTLAPWAVRMGAALGAAALLLAGLFAAAYDWGRLVEVVSDRPSGFQVFVLAGAALSLCVAGFLASGSAERGGAGWKRQALAMLLTVPVIVLVAPETWRGFDLYLRTSSRAMRTITEFFTPFRAGGDLLSHTYALGSGAADLTWAFLLLPPALALAWYRRRTAGRERAFPLVLVAAFSAVALAAGLTQYRYGLLLAPWLGVGAGILVEAACRASEGAQAGRPRRLTTLLAALLLAVLFWPGARAAVQSWVEPARLAAAPAVVEEAMAWLAARTPRASDDLDLRQEPAYGVLSFWGTGHAVIALGRRPALATGFIGTLPGAERSTAFFAQEDPEAAFTFLRQNRLRYLVLEDYPNILANVLFLLGEDGRYRSFLESGAAGLYRSGRVPVAMRLWDTAGGYLEEQGRIFPGTRHFRVVWDGNGVPVREGGRHRVVICEAVPGARLAGTGLPGRRVRASLRLDFRTQRDLPWGETAMADGEGRWTMTVPYPTDRSSGETVARGPYLVERDGVAGVTPVAVPEAAVVEGRLVEVP